MNPRNCLSFSLPIFLVVINIFTSKNSSAAPLVKSCFNSYSDKSYAANLNSLLSSLSSYAASSNANNYKFHNSTAGEDEAVYGLYLCRGDVNKADCATCVQTASKEILTECPNDKTAIVWYDNCLLRYSNQSAFPDTRWFMWNTQNSTDPKRFNDYVGNLLNKLATKTSYVSGKKFAVQEGNFTAFDVVFSLAQCIPDISSLDCDTCLRSAIPQFPIFCNGCLGARVLTPVCNIRFESYLFYNVITQGAPHVDNFSKRSPSGPLKKVLLPPQ